MVDQGIQSAGHRRKHPTLFPNAWTETVSAGRGGVTPDTPASGCRKQGGGLLLNHSHESLRAAGWNAALDDDTVAGDARFPDGPDLEVE